MIREGAPVRVVARETSPPAVKYAGRTGHVTMASPSLYATIFFVQLDEAPDGVHTAFDEEDLVEREGHGDHDGMLAMPARGRKNGRA